MAAIDADNPMKSVVWCACGAYHQVACAQYTKQSNCQCMCTAHKVVAAQCIFGTHNVGKQSVQTIAAPVVITIACCTHKMCGRNAIVDKCFQYFHLVV